MSRLIDDQPLGLSPFHFSDLYDPLKLKTLHTEFWKYCHQTSPEVVHAFNRLDKETLTSGQEGDILIGVARVLGEFIARLFNITGQCAKV